MNEIENILQELVARNYTPSVQYVLFDKDEILQRSCYGLADISLNKAVDEQTTYNAYSVTKTFTALAVLQLAEQQKLDIDDPAINYLPEFPYHPEITIRQILAHTAGIPNPLPLSWIHLASEHDSFDRNQFFKPIFARYNKTKSQPNEKFTYSNLGYVLLGQLIESVTGNTYEKFIINNIFKPIGLTDEIGFEIGDFGKHARGYQKSVNILNLFLGFIIDKSKFMEHSERKWKPFRPLYVNGTPHGGLIGTANAFVLYIQDLLKTESVLISKAYKKMLLTENFTNDHQPTGMCLSWFKGNMNGNGYFTHAGGGGGYYCEIRFYPEKDIGSAIFFNRTGISDKRFLDKVDNSYFRKYENTFNK